MDFKQAIEDIDKGKGIALQKAITQLKKIVDCKPISFSSFKAVCKHVHISGAYCLANVKTGTVTFSGSSEKALIISVCKQESCKLFNLL